MNKQQFINQLRQGLSFLPASELERVLAFYAEMIDDRMEDGMSELQAVAALGDINRIVENVQYEMPVTSLVVSSVKDRTRQAKAKQGNRPDWVNVLIIVLLILGSPLWLVLLIAGVSVLFSLFATLFGAIVAVIAVALAVAVAAVAGLVAGTVLLFINPLAGVAALGVGLVLCGLSVFAYFLAKICVVGLYKLVKLLVRWVKSLFVKKGAVSA